jgi:hypothetical protein
VLRDSKTWNLIASNLEPEIPELRFEDVSLHVRSHRPGASNSRLAKRTQAGLKVKYFRSDSSEAISNSYILLENAWVEHSDVRTDGKGEYRFEKTPPGDYKASIFAWFSNKHDVPCQNAVESKTADSGKVTVEWQSKSGAFMEVVTIKEYSVDSGQQRHSEPSTFTADRKCGVQHGQFLVNAASARGDFKFPITTTQGLGQPSVA